MLLAPLWAPVALWAGLSEDFESLKQQYARDLAALHLPLKKLFAHRLDNLQEPYLRAGRYEDVLAAREIMRGFRESMGEEAWERPLELSFGAEEAVCEAVRAEGGLLSAWQSEGAVASWKLPGLPPGGYEVWVEHGPVKKGIELRLEETRFYVQRTLSEVENEEGYGRSFLGNLKITRGSRRLSLKIGAGAEWAADLQVRTLTLISHAPAP